MNNPPDKNNDIEDMEAIMRHLYKIDSKLRSCPVLAAFRENRRLMAALEKKILEMKTGAKGNDNA